MPDLLVGFPTEPCAMHGYTMQEKKTIIKESLASSNNFSTTYRIPKLVHQQYNFCDLVLSLKSL